jgi:hypothetical protein
MGDHLAALELIEAVVAADMTNSQKVDAVNTKLCSR